MARYSVPLIIRGKVFEASDLEFGGRRGDTRFTAPDVKKYMDRLPLTKASALGDQYRLSFSEILDFLEALGRRLVLSENRHLQESFELGCQTSGLGPDILRYCYETMGKAFERSEVGEVAEKAIGLRYLDGWADSKTANGARVSVRAMGSRTVHIIAGNIPSVSVMTVIRNAMTRGDAIVKTPSNDPLTATAIARTMIDMAPDHPLTRHLSVGYWKGGDEGVEDKLYQPRNIEKIVAWGGWASISHIAKYIQPGIDLICLDPKLSSTIIGREAFSDENTLQTVARAIARDTGLYNQETCTNARVVYVQSGTDREGVAKAERLGEMLWEEIRALPAHLSGPALVLDETLQDEIAAIKMQKSLYRVIGGGNEGTIIVSKFDEPVEFARLLANRVVNLVPFDDLEIPASAVNAYTQTIGIYPESLSTELRERLAFQGAQRLVTVGFAPNGLNHGFQDAMEPMRRMCRWVVQERIEQNSAILKDWRL